MSAAERGEHELTASSLGELALGRDDLMRLVEGVELRVEAYPASGNSFVDDYWVAVFEELGVQHVDLGLDAASIGLAIEVSARVEELLSEPDEQRRRLLPILLRLWLAEHEGSLGSLLHRSTVLVGWEYDEA